jgi:hypothetical protein
MRGAKPMKTMTESSGEDEMHGDDQRGKKQNVIDLLIERADSKGFVTLEDLMEFFPNEDDDQESMRAVIVFLRHEGVDIVGSKFQEKRSSFDPENVDRVMSDPVESDDTVGLYF